MLFQRIPGRSLALFLALITCGALPAARQEPKPGNSWYEDKVDLGFKIKAPKDWEFVPSSPLEPNLIGKYADPGDGKYLNLGKEAFVMVEILLVKFDRRPGKDKKIEHQAGDKTLSISVEGEKDIDSWVTKALDEGKDWHVVEPSKPFKGGVANSTVTIYEGLSTRGRPGESQPERAYVLHCPLSLDLDVALVGLGPGGKKWNSFEKAYTTFAKSLQPLAMGAAMGQPVANDPRSQKRAKLQAEVARSPGWSLYETPNYFILSSYDDKQFIDELKLRLEGIRLVYEKDYPPSKARRITAMPDDEEEEGEGKAASEPGAKEEPPAAAPDPNKTVAQPMVDALELGRCSVVRLCKDHDQYLQYGGPNGTGGYFNPIEEELVIFDDKAVRGRDFTWGVLSHEGFHQYIFAFFGNLSPHSWYNEGTGDYYYGFECKNGKFKEGPARNRIADVKDLINENRHVPLRDFVRWTKGQYYGDNEGNGMAGGPVDGAYCYAQGWSLIWFLRTGAGKAKGWQKDWGTILDRYLAKLLDTSDVDKAVDAAFAGVDWDAFEASWLDYTR